MLASDNIDHLVINMDQHDDPCKGYVPINQPNTTHRHRYCTLNELSNMVRMPINSTEQFKEALQQVKKNTIVTQSVDPVLRVVVNMAGYARSEMPIPFMIFDSGAFPAMLVGPLTTIVKGLGVETHYIHPSKTIDGFAYLLSFVAQQEAAHEGEPYFALQQDPSGLTLGQYRSYSNQVTEVLSRFNLFPAEQLERAVMEKQNVWLVDEVNHVVTHVSGDKRYTLL